MNDGRKPANQNDRAASDQRPAGNDNDPTFAEDLLRGAAEIAGFLFGDTSLRRRVFHLAATSNIPVFRLGSMLCARKSTLLAWIEDQEGGHRA